MNLNCVTNRVAQGPRYKLSYDAKTIQELTHSFDDPILATHAPSRATTIVTVARTAHANCMGAFVGSMVSRETVQRS